eukprot:Tamp_23861.p2 GENE.Tamp_23861~~Tamp_23861.p2  ORF type:complete len:128 (+),score=19.32 Tamp_23861:329-712(+)
MLASGHPHAAYMEHHGRRNTQTHSASTWGAAAGASGRREDIKKFLLQSYELVKSISRTNGVPAKEFVWALKADVQSTTEIARLFREKNALRGDKQWSATIELLSGRGRDMLLLDEIVDIVEDELMSC